MEISERRRVQKGLKSGVIQHKIKLVSERNLQKEVGDALIQQKNYSML